MEREALLLSISWEGICKDCSLSGWDDFIVGFDGYMPKDYENHSIHVGNDLCDPFLINSKWPPRLYIEVYKIIKEQYISK